MMIFIGVVMKNNGTMNTLLEVVAIPRVCPILPSSRGWPNPQFDHCSRAQRDTRIQAMMSWPEIPSVVQGQYSNLFKVLPNRQCDSFHLSKEV